MRSLSALSFSATWLAAAAAVAQVPAVEAEHQRGLDLGTRGQHEEALQVFRALWERTHEPRAEVRMGVAESRLGRWFFAETHLRHGLAQTTDPWIRENRERIAQQLTEVRSHMGQLQVTCNVDRARVQADGRDIGPAPMSEPRWVPAGTVILEVSADGYVTVQRPVRVDLGGIARESIDLRRSLAATAPLAASAPPPATPSAPSMSATAPATPPPTEPPRASRWFAWTALAGGGALGLAGGGLWLLGERSAQDWNDDARCLAGAGTREDLCGDLRARAQVLRPLGVAAVAAGGALVVTGLVLLVRGPRGGSERAMGCGPSLNAAGVLCEGRF